MFLEAAAMGERIIELVGSVIILQEGPVERMMALPKRVERHPPVSR